MPELIVALDCPEAPPALNLAKKLRPQTSWFKVGLELFISAGPQIVRELKALSARVFLDLKLHDIPNTAAKAALACARLSVDMLTIHCQGGFGMCQAVSDVLKPLDKAPAVLGVTVLTSFSDAEMPASPATTAEFALQLARIAASAQLYGVVCSAWEAQEIKAQNPGLACVCPGIRPGWAERNDQARIMTPAEAVAGGADFLVVGRPITQARDPVAATREILTEMADAQGIQQIG